MDPKSGATAESFTLTQYARSNRVDLGGNRAAIPRADFKLATEK